MRVGGFCSPETSTSSIKFPRSAPLAAQGKNSCNTPSLLGAKGTRLLENAVDALKAGREPSLEDLTSQQTEVELRMPSLLPDDFIPDVNTRLSFYKRIASAKNEQDLEEIKVELIDRFGRLPDAARNLLDIARLRQQAQKLGIRKC